jgi:uncharacterized membrane protein
MKIQILIVMISLVFLFLFLPCRIAYSENTVGYNIQIKNDGSSSWIIIQDVGINGSIDTWQQFQNKVTSLVEKAQNKTGREMSVEFEFMTIRRSGSYAVVEYSFNWINFSKTENAKVTIGDVFQVENFFNQLYGDGKVNMTYPSGYIVETVSPQPYERDDSRQTLIWVGTADFTNNTNIVLEKKALTPGLLDALKQNAIIIVSLIAMVSGSLVVFYLFGYRQKMGRKTTAKPEIPGLLEIESDEEKIVKLIRHSGGSLYQSTITERCRFSKAKTSQILSTLESKGIIHRYKKGRQKVVTLTDKNSKIS